MVQEEQLSEVLSEFARTLVTDFPIQGILDHLVRRIITVLPVTSAGVTLIAPGAKPRYIAASDSAALRYESLQTDIGEGPCLLAYETGEAVSVPDLAIDDRFPCFGPAALEAGLAAVFTFPLRQDETNMGALDLYRETTGVLDARAMTAAQTLADVASAYLTNVQSRADARTLSDHYRRTASHDCLTGLPNRMLLQERLEHASRRGRRSRSDAAVLFADLDRFKQVNDTYGHRVGDALLVEVAKRLTALLRPGDTLARVSGDEFVILCEDLHDRSDVELLADRIDAAFAIPFQVQDVEVSITASVGIAFAGMGQNLCERVVNEADTAMYQAKRKGGAAHQVLDAREADQAQKWQELAEDLRKAVDNNGLAVHYQPIVHTHDGLMTGVEALLRWRHPRRRPVSPQAMVAMAEQIGLIRQIGEWVLERACRDHRQWLDRFPDQPLELAVNISTTQLMELGFCESVGVVLDRTRTDPTRVILEMTEDIFIEDSQRAGAILQDLNRMGVRTTLDDFGTGYSSLNYLRSFPVKALKIDRAFVDIGADPDDSLMLTAITGLAHALRLTVTAEGIETDHQRDAVATAGCDFSQGFLYAHALAADGITSLLESAADQHVYLPLGTQRCGDHAMRVVDRLTP